MLKVIFVESTECLNEDAQKEKGQILYITGRADQIATSAKLRDITHESYGFNADLLNNKYQCSKAGFSGVITGFVVMCKD